MQEEAAGYAGFCIYLIYNAGREVYRFANYYSFLCPNYMNLLHFYFTMRVTEFNLKPVIRGLTFNLSQRKCF